MNTPESHPLYGQTYGSLREMLSRLFSPAARVEQGALDAAGQSPGVTARIDAVAQPYGPPAALPAAPAAPAAMPDPGAMPHAPVRAGQHAGIDEGTRARALAWALRNAQAGGA
jgi:hypothetical protein